MLHLAGRSSHKHGRRQRHSARNGRRHAIRRAERVSYWQILARGRLQSSACELSSGAWPNVNDATEARLLRATFARREPTNGPVAHLSERRAEHFPDEPGRTLLAAVVALCGNSLPTAGAFISSRRSHTVGRHWRSVFDTLTSRRSPLHRRRRERLRFRRTNCRALMTGARPPCLPPSSAGAKQSPSAAVCCGATGRRRAPSPIAKAGRANIAANVLARGDISGRQKRAGRDCRRSAAGDGDGDGAADSGRA